MVFRVRIHDRAEEIVASERSYAAWCGRKKVPTVDVVCSWLGTLILEGERDQIAVAPTRQDV